jgi:ribosomal protein L40E
MRPLKIKYWYMEGSQPSLGTRYTVLLACLFGPMSSSQVVIQDPNTTQIFMTSPDNTILAPLENPVSIKSETNNYPHICPRCGAPAYIGMNQIECKKCQSQQIQ